MNLGTSGDLLLRLLLLALLAHERLQVFQSLVERILHVLHHGRALLEIVLVFRSCGAVCNTLLSLSHGLNELLDVGLVLLSLLLLWAAASIVARFDPIHN